MRYLVIAVPLLIALPVSAQTAFEKAHLNIGGGEVVWNDQTWQAGATVGVEGTVLQDTANSPNGLQQVFAGTIYETQTHSAQGVKLSVPVPAGQYELQLHFAELWHPDGSVGARVFDVVIEDQVVGKNIDVLAATGGRANDPFIATIGGVQPDFNAAKDTIDIEIRSVRDHAILNGITVACAAGATCVWPAGAEPSTASMSMGVAEAPPLAAAPANDVIALAGGGPVVGAYNLGGPAMQYGSIAFEADAFASSRGTGVEGPGNTGPNGLQTNILDTPFASVHWGGEIAFSAPVPPGPVTVDLYFVEGWWPEAGRRIMNIEVEGRLVRENYDIVAAGGNDFTVPQILRIEDVDPTLSGDPGKIDIRVLSVQDNAVLSAVVLRGCDGDAAQCAARIEAAAAARAAEAERLQQEAEAAARAEALANRKPMVARYSQEYSIRLDSGPWVARSITLDFNLYGLEDGFVVHVTDKNLNYHERLLGLGAPGQRVNCAIFFSPAEEFMDAAYQGDTCGDASGPFELSVNLGEGHKGKPVLVGRLGGVNYNLPLEGPRNKPGAVPNPLPAERPDFKGVVFDPDIETLKRQIEAAILDGATGADWQAGAYDGYGVLTLSSPPAEGTFAEAVDTFQIYTTPVDGAERAWGFSRRWFPPEDSQPFADQFDEAIFGKYGDPSGELRNPDRFARHPRIGWVWSLDEQGAKGDQNAAYRCMWDFVDREAHPTRAWLSTENWRDATAPWILTRDTCGYQMVISPAVLRSNNRVRNVIFFYHDPNAAEIVRWNQAEATGRSLLDNAEVRALAAEKLKTAGPDAPKKQLDL